MSPYEKLLYFVTSMAEYDCDYLNSQKCLSVHVSELSHGMCIGCQARQTLLDIGLNLKTLQFIGMY